MIRFQASGQDVARCLDNALLWVDDTAKYTPGKLLVTLSDRELTIAGFSDIVIGLDQVRDETSAVGNVVMFEISEEQARNIIAMVRPRRLKPVQLKWDNYLLVNEDPERLSPDGEVYEGTEFYVQTDPSPAWSKALTLLERNEVDEVPGYVAFHHELLARLGRVKADKAAPVDLSFEKLDGHDSYLVHVKVGPTFRAALTSIRREVAAVALDEKAEASLWN